MTRLQIASADCQIVCCFKDVLLRTPGGETNELHFFVRAFGGPSGHLLKDLERWKWKTCENLSKTMVLV